MKLLILDTETSGLDPESSHLLEVATAIYSVEHHAVTRARSWLVEAPSNEAEAINGIPAALVKADGCDPCYSGKWVQSWASECAAIIAYNSDFDRQWFGPMTVTTPWVDAQDFAWPRPSASKSLIAVALAHGIGVASAHRALADVMILASLLARAAELGMDVEEQVRRGLRPRALFAVAATSFDEARNALAKENGFRFDSATKTWRRRLAREDAEKLPFAVREVA